MRSLIPSFWTGGRGMSDPVADMRREMQSLFSRSGGSWPSPEVGFPLPAINIAETADAIEVTVELPGVDEKDISVDIDGGRLIISGEKKAEEKKEDKNWRVVESSYGSFQRVISLPFEPQSEACEAHFDKGVLRLTIARPKNAPQQKSRIEIKSGENKSGASAQEGSKGGKTA